MSVRNPGTDGLMRPSKKRVTSPPATPMHANKGINQLLPTSIVKDENLRIVFRVKPFLYQQGFKFTSASTSSAVKY